jgi:hypothetical protein
VGAADRVARLKRARLSAALILTLLCPNAWVMSTDDAAHDATIAEALAMDEGQERKFWPIFREYRYELAKLNHARQQLLDDFGTHGAALSVAQAREWIDGWLDNEASRVKLTDRFVKRFRRVLPVAKVALLLVLENARAVDEVAQAMVGDPVTGGNEEVHIE